MALAWRSFGAGAAVAPEVFPIGGCPRGPRPCGRTWTGAAWQHGDPSPWPPEAPGDHMVGASRQPPAQRGLVFFGFLRSLGFWCAGETLPVGLNHPAGPVAGIC